MKYIDKLNKLISSVTGMEGPYGSLLIDTILLFVLVKLVERLFNFFFGIVINCIVGVFMNAIVHKAAKCIEINRHCNKQ